MSKTCWMYTVSGKKYHFVFDYTWLSHFLVDFFGIFIPLKTGMTWWRHNCETSPAMKVLYHWKYKYSTKQIQTVSLQPNYVSTLPGKLKIAQKQPTAILQCILLNRLFQTFAESRSVFLSFPVCQKILLAVFWQNFFYISMVFLSKIYLQTQYGKF